MEDVHNWENSYKLKIDKVGVKNVTVPIRLKNKETFTPSIATINLFVDLHQNSKGTHMSRIIESIDELRKELLNIIVIEKILCKTITNLSATSGTIEIKFPFFIEKEAPISKKKSVMEYKCIVSSHKNSNTSKNLITVEVPVTTVCPCSKEISKYGAHNQRNLVTIKAESDDFNLIKELIYIVEKNSSCQIYPLLKRADEAHVTEKAYENPMFVEDIVRSVAVELKNNEKISWFSVESEAFESIHPHNAYAYLESNKWALSRKS